LGIAIGVIVVVAAIGLLVGLLNSR
jgi:hypothetical protein